MWSCSTRTSARRAPRARCDPDAPPVLLIMGVGAQLPMWPTGSATSWSSQGYRVIQFDHRDTGLSTKMHGRRADGSVYPRVLRQVTGRRSEVPYTLVDMATMSKGLLDHLGINGRMSSAHRWAA